MRAKQFWITVQEVEQRLLLVLGTTGITSALRKMNNTTMTALNE